MKGIEDLPDNYKEFKRMGRRVLPPVNAPTSIPALPADIEEGIIRSATLSLSFGSDALEL